MSAVLQKVDYKCHQHNVDLIYVTQMFWKVGIREVSETFWS